MHLSKTPNRALPALVAAVAAVALTLAACGDAVVSQAPSTGPRTFAPTLVPANLAWPVPPGQMDLTIAAGLEPEIVEHLAFHVHAHLDVFIDGVPVAVPAGIGINIADPGVTTFDEPDGSKSYGGIEGCDQPCISPLHTHAQFGVIHTESATATPNTLGQFFIEWGVKLSATCVGEHCSPATPVAFYLTGEAFAGDPTGILLNDQLEIAIVIGTPPAVIPSTGDLSRP